MDTITCCSVGKFLHDSCHQTRFTGKTGVRHFGELGTESHNLLQVRLNHIFSSDDTICLHHEQTYHHKYSNWQIKCCDPW